MAIIKDIFAREIIDSRGHPTVEVDVVLNTGRFGRASVPSGASTGVHEVIELRDNDKKRFNGKGVLTACNNVNREIFEMLSGIDVEDQVHIDRSMTQLDGTRNKERLGANAILAVSLAVAKAASAETSLPLYRYIGGTQASLLPVPMMNIINGGVHADNPVDIQELMIMPIGAETIADAIRMGSEIFHILKNELQIAGYSTNVGDEGGFAPNLVNTEQALDFIMQAIEKANYKPGEDIMLALDAASSEFYQEGIYSMTGEDKSFNSEELVNYYQGLVNHYPIFSIEDGMAEDDWHGWELLTRALGDSTQLVGDDLFVTSSSRLKKGIDMGVANSVLVKVNQIGTLTETLETVEIGKKAKYTSVISHRSGETEDTFIADLAVAVNSGQIKTGSLSRSDRLAKYNQLIRIEQELGPSASYAGKSILKVGSVSA